VENSNPKKPLFFFDSLPLPWQMTCCEKFVLASLLEQAHAKVAVEVGTFKGGSLQLISAKTEKVYSLDINPETQEALREKFANVEFLAGDSKILLPKLIEKLQSESAPLGFVLIDGDHSAEVVRNDIKAVLRFVPNQPVYIVLHDSFNPDCRRGMLDADWSDCPYVHFVEIDFVSGMFFRKALEYVQPGSMWGGLAVAIMLPDQRNFDLKISESQKDLFEVAFSRSCHNQSPKESVFKRFSRFISGK
jgi:hypothetical protein